MPTVAITPENITKLFLYGSTTVPANLADEALIRSAPPQPLTIQIDVSQFMTSGAGRFGKAAASPLVAAFFDDTTLAPGSYTKAQLATYFNLSYYGWSISANDYGDSTDDIVARTYLFHSQKFKLADSVEFVVDANGYHHIENYVVEPNQDPIENFDFLGGGILAGIGNGLLQRQIDPWGIGQTVEFQFTGTQTGVSYDEQDYLNDLASLQNWESNGQSLLALADDLLSLADDLNQAGITSFVDQNGRAIVYGTTNGDDIQVSSSFFASNAPTLADPAAEHGVTIVGGAGNDILRGDDTSDDIRGGADNDFLFGFNGNDILSGGAGSDFLVGGAGNDEINGQDGDDLLFLADLNALVASKTKPLRFVGQPHRHMPNLATRPQRLPA